MADQRQSNKTGVLTSGESISYWLDSSTPLQFETLSRNIDTDILIVGAGIAGLTTAYLLTKAGRQVTVVEDGVIGSGESGRTTAHLTCALDDRYYELEKTFGEAGARKAAASHTAAIDLIEQIVRAENIDCSFERVNGYLFIHPTDTKENLQKEFAATQKAGLSTEWLDWVPALEAISPCILFREQGQFHIMHYLQGLARAIVRLGVNIYTQTHARHLNKQGAECNGYAVKASQIVVATNTPVNDVVTMHTKQFPYRTYVIGAKVAKGLLPHALWWDTGNQNSTWTTKPYHYIRLQHFDEENDLLIIGGEDHKTGQADEESIPEEERYSQLILWATEQFPMMRNIVYKWSGQVLEPIDYMAYIGKNPGDDNIYIITGDSGNGMTHGTLGGLLITDQIMGRENEWADLYSPKRIPLKAPVTYLKEIGNMARQYADFFSKGDIKELDELTADTGAIISKGLQKIAVYKDERGAIHAFSAVCPHLGCVLQWNGAERSFDCPCHGSRFTKLGVVINGPATSNLESLRIKEAQ
jgi:glycine/D-amino acid oxidase-like deaminating enzyme/nitrite reductase/ring-hydroxylating ferredoxin subunit